MKKKLLYGVLGFLLFLTLCNPSLSDFKDHGHSNWATKDKDFIIFSIYWDKEGGDSNASTIYYVGILKNFWEIIRTPPIVTITPGTN